MNNMVCQMCITLDLSKDFECNEELKDKITLLENQIKELNKEIKRR